MNDRELTYVKTIAEEGSISAAARKLYIAQPSLSQSLARIEDSLGTKLFDRTPGGLKVTQAGRRYIAMANQILKLYDDLRVELSDMDDLRGGTVVFGTTLLLGKMLLPEVLPVFHRAYPRVKLRIVEGDSRELDSKIVACEVNFAIMHKFSGRMSRHINYRVFGEDPFIVTVAANSPLIEKAVPCDAYPYPLIDIHDLASEPLITVRYRQGIRQVIDAMFTRVGVRPNILLELRDYSTAQDLAARGMGYTIGPASYTQTSRSELFGAQYLSLDVDLGATWDLCVATFRDASLSRADTQLISFFEAAMASHL